VTLGSTGTPESIEVDYDWKQYLRPAAFGAAVVEAAQAATERQREAWLRGFIDGDIQGAVERLETEPDGASPDPLPPRPRRDPDATPPGDLDELVRDLLAAASDAEAFAAAPPAQGVGSTGFGKLELTASAAGLTSCMADPDWVSQRSGEELTEALATALAAARDDLARAAAADPAGRLRALLDRIVNM
jgi:hypothetical protein